MTASPILALDIGTTAVKVARFHADGTLDGAVIAARHRDESGGGVGGELDPFAVLAAAERGMREVGLDGIDVVATSSVWHALVAVDRDGQPLGSALSWEASRPPEERAHLAVLLGDAWSHEMSGGYLHPSHAVAVLPVLLAREPARIVDLASWVVGRLAGTSLAWPENVAAGSGLWLPQERRWNGAALAAFGIDESCLGSRWEAAVAGTGSPIPELRAASWLPPVGDGLCHNLGQAAFGGRVAVTVGTSGSVRAVTGGEPYGGPGHGLWRYRVDASTVATGGAVTSAGNVLEWGSRLFGRPIPWQQLHASRIAHLPRTDPAVFGRRGPDYPWAARGALFDLAPDTSADDLLLALAVDIGKVFSEHLASLQSVMNGSVSEIVVEGGVVGAAPMAAQLLADAFGMPVGRTAIAQPSLAGAAALGATHRESAGGGIDETVARLSTASGRVSVSEVFHPRPDVVDALAQRWAGGSRDEPSRWRL